MKIMALLGFVLLSGCLGSNSLLPTIQSLPNGTNVTFVYDYESDGVILFNGCNASSKENISIMANCHKGCVLFDNGSIIKSKCFDNVGGAQSPSFRGELAPQ